MLCEYMIFFKYPFCSIQNKYTPTVENLGNIERLKGKKKKKNF